MIVKIPGNNSDDENIFWLPAPDVYCGYGITMPQDFLNYIYVERLLLRSQAIKSPLVWKTLTGLIRSSRQKSVHTPIIIEASKDADDWA